MAISFPVVAILGALYAGAPYATREQTCTPYGFHWAYDNRALAVGTGGALVEQGGDTWFFITADYAFGHSLEAETGRYVTSKGGKVTITVGAERQIFDHPVGKDIDAQMVVDLRHMLTAAGYTPS